MIDLSEETINEEINRIYRQIIIGIADGLILPRTLVQKYLGVDVL